MGDQCQAPMNIVVNNRVPEEAENLLTSWAPSYQEWFRSVALVMNQ
jgi:hypothetical protein